MARPSLRRRGAAVESARPPVRGPACGWNAWSAAWTLRAVVVLSLAAHLRREKIRFGTRARSLSFLERLSSFFFFFIIFDRGRGGDNDGNLAGLEKRDRRAGGEGDAYKNEDFVNEILAKEKNGLGRPSPWGERSAFRSSTGSGGDVAGKRSLKKAGVKIEGRDRSFPTL